MDRDCNRPARILVTSHIKPYPRAMVRPLWENTSMITRRETFTIFGAASVTALAPGRTWAQNASVQDLAVPGPLGDVWLGPADAKVTIIEYASLTCSHCAAFHRDTYPKLKERYIDTGKVRFTLRE